MNGILNVYKPQGPTSYQILARIKSITGEKKIGHGGTLDPLASGVLPVFFNQATRLVEYLQEQSKTYVATIKLGVTTDSFDCSGRVVSTSDTTGITSGDIESKLSLYTGDIMQMPPVFSALKQGGTPLYQLARQGRKVETQARRVCIYQLKLNMFRSPVLTLEIDCSKGTYVRSLAHDLGQTLGVGAILTDLVRTRYGPFGVADAVDLEDMEIAAYRGSWSSLLKPMKTVLQGLPSVILSQQQSNDVILGKKIELSMSSQNGYKEICAQTNDLSYLLLMEFEGASGLWRPKKVLKSWAFS
jgi:tRNA pseudouridine55 synthase